MDAIQSRLVTAVVSQVKKKERIVIFSSKRFSQSTKNRSISDFFSAFIRHTRDYECTCPAFKLIHASSCSVCISRSVNCTHFSHTGYFIQCDRHQEDVSASKHVRFHLTICDPYTVYHHSCWMYYYIKGNMNMVWCKCLIYERKIIVGVSG